jgi:hypothetical protein
MGNEVETITLYHHWYGNRIWLSSCLIRLRINIAWWRGFWFTFIYCGKCEQESFQMIAHPRVQPQTLIHLRDFFRRINQIMQWQYL